MADREKAQRAADTIGVIQTIAQIASMVPSEDLDLVAEQISHYDTVMPLLDPTAWMRTASNAADNKEVIGAFIAFHKRLAKVAGKG